MAAAAVAAVGSLSPLDDSAAPCVLVELFEPADGVTNLCNWILAHKAVSKATVSVIVHVSPDRGQLSFPAYRRMMKTGYTVLWDAARVVGKFDLVFSVVGDVPTHGLEAASACVATGQRVDCVMVTRPDGILARRGEFDRSLCRGANAEPPRWEDARSVIGFVPADLHVVDFEAEPLPLLPKVVLGGTFDRLHSGHRMLLTYAAAAATEEVIVGVCNDEMLAAKSDQARIQPLAARRAAVEQFLRGINPSLRVRVVPIGDPFGPSIVEEDISAIAVSSETLRGAVAVNQKRVERGLSRLKVLVTNRFEAHSLSSSFIRANTAAPAPASIS